MSECAIRLQRAQQALEASTLDALVVGVGPDLEYLTGYSAHELERLNVLVVRPGHSATMVMPRLEVAGFPPLTEVDVRAWADGDDALGILFEVLTGCRRVAVSDSMRAHFVVPMMHRSPDLELALASEVLGPLRAVKSTAEQELLIAAGRCADVVTTAVVEGRLELVGRTERQVELEIRERLVSAGLDTAEFAIVGSGPNSASPHHAPGERVIQRGEVVLFDIGGRRGGYHSDTTRCVHTGPVPPEVAAAWEVLVAAHAAGLAEARVGKRCQDVDRAARAVVVEAGFGDHFIHRTGHGIGLQGHEEPYIVAGNELPLQVGHAFSIEPGVYFDGAWGLRLEDIVVVGDDAPTICNQTPRVLAEV